MTKETKRKKESNPVRYDFDRLASTFAVALSIAAILISVMEVRTAQKQTKALAWPYLQINGSYSQNGYQVVMQNKGVGPALVGDFALVNSNGEVRDLDTLIFETLGEKDAFSYESYKASNPTNSVIARNEEINLFSVKWEEHTIKLIENWEGNVDIVACYCSIHSDCWETSLINDVKRTDQTCSISREMLP